MLTVLDMMIPVRLFRRCIRERMMCVERTCLRQTAVSCM